MYAYVGDVSKATAKRLMEKYPILHITGEWPDGKVQLGIKANKPEWVVDAMIRIVERG